MGAIILLQSSYIELRLFGGCRFYLDLRFPPDRRPRPLLGGLAAAVVVAAGSVSRSCGSVGTKEVACGGGKGEGGRGWEKKKVTKNKGNERKR